MEPSYWRERWRDGRIGFHEGRPNALLVRHGREVLGGAARVLAPLCGKAADLAWLGKPAPEGLGARVVGIELVQEAARAFFDEQGIPARSWRDGGFMRWAGGAIEIVVGDFFEVTPVQVGTFEAAWDRAALVALPPPMRQAYVAHQRALLEPGARVLLVSVEHDLGEGPPFDVREDEVRRLWHGCRVDVLADPPESCMPAREARPYRERAYRIELPS